MAAETDPHVSLPHQHPDSKRSRRFGCWLTACLLLLLVVVLPLSGLLAWRQSSAGRVQQQLHEMALAGQPTTASDLDAIYPLPEGEDTTHLWLEAIDLLSSSACRSDMAKLPIVGNGAPVPALDQPWPQQPAIEQFLEQWHDAVDAAHSAANQGGQARYDLNFEAGFMLDLGHAQELRSVTRVMQLESHLKLRQGDAEGVFQSLRTIHRAATSLNNEPLLICGLIAIAIDNIGSDQIRALVPQTDATDQQLAELQQVLSEADYKLRLRRALIGERTLGISVMSDLSSVRALSQDADLGLNPQFMLNPQDDLSFYIDMMSRAIDHTERPWPQAIAELKKIERQVEASTGGTLLGRVRYQLSTAVAPATQAVVGASARAQAARNASLLVLAIERFRRQHGRLPVELPELVPDCIRSIPLDPYDGQRLRYSPSLNHYVLYSVGDNLRDDGGDGTPNGGADFVFHVELPVTWRTQRTPPRAGTDSGETQPENDGQSQQRRDTEIPEADL